AWTRCALGKTTWGEISDREQLREGIRGTLIEFARVFQISCASRRAFDQRPSNPLSVTNFTRPLKTSLRRCTLGKFMRAEVEATVPLSLYHRAPSAPLSEFVELFWHWSRHTW